MSEADRALALLRGDAEDVLRLAPAHPRRAFARAESVLARACAMADPEAISMAEQALGLAARQQGDIRDAVQHLDRSVRVAERGGLAHRAAQARLSQAVALAIAGRTTPALRALDLAASVLQGTDLARLEVQRSGVLRRLGRHDDALAAIRRALPPLRRAGDELWEVRALGIRGLVRVEQGAWAAGEDDLRAAQDGFARLGLARDAAVYLHNRAWSAACAGEVTTALARFEEAEQLYAKVGFVIAELPHDRARLLLSVGLGQEALEMATEAARRYEASEHGNGWSEALLTCAEAALLVRDHALARSRAAEARRAFAHQRRSGWVALARHIEAKAAWEAGDRSVDLMRAALRATRDLERHTLTPLAAESLLIAGRVASTLGRRDDARAALLKVSRHRNRRAPAVQRAHAWLAEAMVRLEDGRAASARSALAAGLRVVDDYRATLGATELRVHASTAGAELSALGLQLAAASGRADQLLAWTERSRANALRLRPVRPPHDDALRNDLAALRRVVADIEAAATARRPTSALYTRRSELERSIRDRTRRLSGEGRGARATTPSLKQLAAALHGAALVELVDLDGSLRAITVARGRCRAQDLGAVERIEREADAARFALRRLAHTHGTPRSLEAARAAAVHAGLVLDDLLLAPLRRQIGEQTLVVVPPARLHALPWALLPSCRERPVVVAPSAACWLDGAEAAVSGGGPVALVAGPGLAGADAELDDIARLHGSAIELRGPDATAAAVSGALDGAELAHVAAHFAFRADNPLFSALRLADGPLTVYDFEGVRRSPRRIVLSACDSGLATVHPGDELMGLAAALLPMGTASIVASVIPVPDHATRAVMVGLHRHLIAGDDLATALAQACAVEGDEDPAAFAARAAFVCLGSG